MTYVCTKCTTTNPDKEFKCSGCKRINRFRQFCAGAIQADAKFQPLVNYLAENGKESNKLRENVGRCASISEDKLTRLAAEWSRAKPIIRIYSQSCNPADFEWVLPYFAEWRFPENTNVDDVVHVCTRFNHSAGYGCERNDNCFYEHVCVVCGEKHGVFTRDKKSGNLECEWQETYLEQEQKMKSRIKMGGADIGALIVCVRNHRQLRPSRTEKKSLPQEKKTPLAAALPKSPVEKASKITSRDSSSTPMPWGYARTVTGFTSNKQAANDAKLSYDEPAEPVSDPAVSEGEPNKKQPNNDSDIPEENHKVDALSHLLLTRNEDNNVVKGNAEIGQVHAAELFRARLCYPSYHIEEPVVVKLWSIGSNPHRQEQNRLTIIDDHLKSVKAVGDLNLDHIVMHKTVVEIEQYGEKFIMLIMEECQNNLAFYITMTLNEETKDIKEYAKSHKNHITQLVDVYMQMHSNNIAHRDVKPANILVKDLTQMPLELKLCDFEKSREMDFNKTSHTQRTVMGTKDKYGCWFAPEMDPNYQSKENIFATYFATDVWSLGCVMHYIATNGDALFSMPSEIHQEDLRVERLRASQLHSINPVLFDLIERMVRPQAKARLSMSVVRTHPYFWTLKETMIIIKQIKEDTFGNHTHTSSIRKDLKQISTAVLKNCKGGSWLGVVKDKLLVDDKKIVLPFDYTCIVDLIRFMRNAFEHCFPFENTAVYVAAYRERSKEIFLESVCQEIPRLLIELWCAVNRSTDYTFNPNSTGGVEMTIQDF